MNMNDLAKSCPCRSCKPPKRHIAPSNCHDECEAYKTWKTLSYAFQANEKMHKCNH